jgi:hypothetical protein
MERLPKISWRISRKFVVQLYMQISEHSSVGVWESGNELWKRKNTIVATRTFSYPEPILRAVNGARQGALAKSISNWHLIGHNEGCSSNTGYILLPCFYGIRLWIWPFSYPEPFLRAVNRARQGPLAKSISNWHLIGYNEGYCSNNVYIFYHVFMVSGFGFGQSLSSHRA